MSSTPLQPPQKDFFVSYTRTDRDWAKWIAHKLEDNGYSVILQAWDFQPGANFILEMDDATQRARRTIAVLSPDYIKAVFTKTEWAAAFVQDPTGSEGTLLPVRIAPFELKGLLRPIGYIDLVGLDEQEALEKLLQGVSRTRAKPTASPRFPGSPTPASGSSSPSPFPKNANTQASLPWEALIVNAEEDEKFRIELEKYLRPLERAGQITTWHRDKLLAGETFQQGIDKHFYKAKLILLLISPDFLNSSDCYMLTEEAVKRSKIQETRVIPILIRPCDWKDSPFSGLITIPRNSKLPISQWSNKDAAYLKIAQELQDVLPKP